MRQICRRLFDLARGRGLTCRWLSWPDEIVYDRTRDAGDGPGIPAVRRYDTLSTSELARVYDEVLRELYGPDYADQAETLRELEYVIRARTGHDVRCSALRGGFDCDCYKLTAAHAEDAAEIWARRWIDHKRGSR